MLIYKIFLRPEWDAFVAAGETAGAPVDRADGFIHFSAAPQLAETAVRYFDGISDLVLVACAPDSLAPALKWEVSRGGPVPAPLSCAATARRGVGQIPAAGCLWPYLSRRCVLSLYEDLGLAVLHRFDPETAHGLSLRALQLGLVSLPGPYTSARLATTVAGLAMPNPIGLAAGYDKNATALSPLSRAGFGFIEAGAATPRPQDGNSRPRLFRLTEDRAVINRFGFNNQGATAIAARLAARKPGPVPVGLNLGANKDSPDRAADFARVLAQCGRYVDFATVNVSSPNTEKLRDLQGRAALTAVLAGVMFWVRSRQQ